MKVRQRKLKKTVSKRSKIKLKKIKKGIKSTKLNKLKKVKAVSKRKGKNISAFQEMAEHHNKTALHEENIIKLVKKLLGNETIDAVPGYDEEINLLQDLDLMVLGSSPEEYKRYRELLRKEYSQLDDPSYKKMRLKEDEPQASTSGTLSKKKPFKKIKDNKYRQKLAQKYRLNSSSNRLGSTSLSQTISKKLVHQIKKRNSLSKSQRYSKLSKRVMRNNTDANEDDSNDSKESSENLDDDCICIENKTEVILIDDENPSPINEVKEFENKYKRFKHYEAIGKIRMELNNTCITNEMMTSTPNPRRSNDKHSNQKDNDFSFESLSFSAIDNDEVTIVEDGNNIQSNDVIVISDAITPHIKRSNRRKRKRTQNDDSVIFVSENVPAARKSSSSAPAFIPLITPIEETQIRVRPASPNTPKKKRQRNEFFTTQEEKQLEHYNQNTYNPNKETATDAVSQKRMVIVDGSNVAYQHALNKEFSVKGLKICLDYFAKMGHEVKAVVPQFRLKSQRSTDPNELETMHREGKIVFTPCKNLPGKSATSYDDRFILQLASELDAAIVSNDNYRDLLNENSAFKKIIENRVIGYTWCNDIFLLPKDPYGKWGPTLASILNRSSN